MNENEYADFHRLLAKLKYEIAEMYIETDNKDLREHQKELLDAIDKIMLLIVVDGYKL